MRKTSILLVILMSILLSSCTSTQEPVEEKMTRTVSVSGSGEVAFTPDMASFSVSFRNTADTTQEAQEKTNEAMQIVYDILMGKYGVEAKDIRTTGMSLSPRYRWEEGEQILIGQESTQSIDVKVYDLELLGGIVDDISTVSGIEFSSIQLGLKDRTAALVQAREKAMQDAMAKAGSYATTSGMTLGMPMTINDSNGNFSYSNFSPRLLMATATAESSASAPSASYYQGDVKVSASVSVTFELLPGSDSK